MASAGGGNGQPAIDRAEHIGPGETGDNISAKRVANYYWNGSTWQRAGSALSERYDYANSSTIYTAFGPVGTSDATTGWTITKYDLSDSSNASGKIATDVSWNDRAIGTYS